MKNKFQLDFMNRICNISPHHCRQAVGHFRLHWNNKTGKIVMRNKSMLFVERKYYGTIIALTHSLTHSNNTHLLNILSVLSIAETILYNQGTEVYRFFPAYFRAFSCNCSKSSEIKYPSFRKASSSALAGFQC